MLINSYLKILLQFTIPQATSPNLISSKTQSDPSITRSISATYQSKLPKILTFLKIKSTKIKNQKNKERSTQHDDDNPKGNMQEILEMKIS